MQKEEFSSRPPSGNSCRPLPKKSSCCARTYIGDCLVLYPESVWFATQNQLRCRLNKWNAKQQMIFRQFVSDAEIMIHDGNGRILLPKRYLQMAGIQSDVRFIGVDNTIEIWAKERAEQPFMNHDEFSEALEELLGDENICCDENKL